jgi:DNA-binding FadR family transcriptional regulator
VSVGTLHEALRLLQATGEITVRPGPGGGVFAGDRSALSELLRDVRRTASLAPDFSDAARVLSALSPLIIEDVITHAPETGLTRLSDALADLTESASGGALQEIARSSLELFAVIVSLTPSGLLQILASSVLRAQISVLPDVGQHVDAPWAALISDHIRAVTDMVEGILRRDLTAALMARRTPAFIALFAALVAGQHAAENRSSFLI